MDIGWVFPGLSLSKADPADRSHRSPFASNVPLADGIVMVDGRERAAARDGRLTATFSPRPFFGKLTATATREAGERFMANWYRRTYGRGRRRLVAVCRTTVPATYAAILAALRHRLRLSQQQLAVEVGAASKAVVYQWESGKRKPSPVLWQRVEALCRARLHARRTPMPSKESVARHLSNRPPMRAYERQADR